MEDWVKVGAAPDETRARLMMSLLEDAGIPVVLRRPTGFDVLAEVLTGHGSQEVVVPRDRAEEARQRLEDTMGTGLEE